MKKMNVIEDIYTPKAQMKGRKVFKKLSKKVMSTPTVGELKEKIKKGKKKKTYKRFSAFLKL